MLAAVTVIALVSLVTQSYNPSCGYCVPYPMRLLCVSLTSAVDGVECVRGSLTITLVIGFLLNGFMLLVAV